MDRVGVAFIRSVKSFRPSGVAFRTSSTASQLPFAGSGVGKGGGAGGSVRELGGAFGQREAAEEEVYFRKLTAQQLEELRSLHMAEIRCLEKDMKEHAAAIERHKQKLRALKKMEQAN